MILLHLLFIRYLLEDPFPYIYLIRDTVGAID